MPVQTWASVSHFDMATDGTTMVKGKVREGNLLLSSAISYPGAQVILQKGHAIPGTSEAAAHIGTITRSPNGTDVVATVRPQQTGSRQIILLNGSPLVLPSGMVATGEPCGAALNDAAIGSGAVWTEFSSIRVNDAGDVLFHAWVTSSTGTHHAAVRNGRQLPKAATRKVRILDQRGFALLAGGGNSLSEALYEDEPLLTCSADIDYDGDGLPDAGYELEADGGQDRPDISGAGTLYAAALVNTPLGERLPVIVRRDLSPEGNVVCDGLPNHAIAMPIVSLTSQAGVQPPGSQGMLCLGGAIGRAVAASFHVGVTGSGSATLPLNIMPQPSGVVAVQSGDTWYTQLWYRDVVQGSPTSNFSDAIATTFR